MNKHTPTPWYAWFEEKNEFHNGRAYIAQAEGAPHTRHYSDVASTVDVELPEIQKANAEHIVRCVNSHEALVKALTVARDEDDYCLRNGMSAMPANKRQIIDEALSSAGAPQ
ncbi:hypothetical protein [Herbaspirillum huttiense]|uniref:hypothetical protein n=1 Tax=Herbaspirillum huttiense TaxID=863372 RepID=UPI0031DF9E80